MARATARRREKSAAAFRTISEVSGELDLPQHVLRFWETKFNQVKPMKRGGGRRYYRPEDVALLRRIRDLLHAEGYTIRGVQKLLRENGGKVPAPTPAEPKAAAPSANKAADKAPALAPDRRATLEAILAELEEMRRILREAGG